MHIKEKKGQSTVEYILLVTAVIAVMIVFATNKSGGIQGQLNNALSQAANDMNGAADILSASHATQAAGKPTHPPYWINVNADADTTTTPVVH